MACEPDRDGRRRRAIATTRMSLSMLGLII